MRSRRLSLQSYGQPLTCKSATVRDWGRRAPLHGPGAVHSRGLRGRVCSTPRAAQPRRGRGSRDKGSSQARPGGQAGRQAGAGTTAAAGERTPGRALTPWGRAQLHFQLSPRAPLPGKPGAAVSSASEKAAARTWNVVSPRNCLF